MTVYKPSLGRFISVDPAQFDSLHNPYTFVENNPATMNDPMGDMAYSPTTDCEGPKVDTIRQDDASAAEWVRKARSYTDRDPEVYENCRKSKQCHGEEFFKLWFGARDDDYENRYQWDRVETFFRREHRRFQERHREYRCDHRNRYHPEWEAMSGAGWAHIVLYSSFWDTYLSDESRTRMFVHEWAHSAGVTCGHDEVYGYWPARHLAESDQIKARKNADNYAYFAEDVFRYAAGWEAVRRADEMVARVQFLRICAWAFGE